MVVFRFILILCFISLYSCTGNFFPNDEETGEAAKQRCAVAVLALSETNNRSESCDECLLGIIRNCKQKESGQLIKF